MTPLLVAAQKGYDNILQILLDYGALINESTGTTFKTPLFIAAYKLYNDVIQQLIDAQADINQPNAKGYTPLLAALNNGHYATVQLLLDNGADKNILYDNKTALAYAKTQEMRNLVAIAMQGIYLLKSRVSKNIYGFTDSTFSILNKF